jgi:Protein of unknown function (DUF3551)
MRALPLAAVILYVAGTMCAGAAAQSYSWCAYFTGGPVTCEFATLEQCMRAIRGKTALCDQNAQIVPPSNTQPKPAHRTKSASAPSAGAEAVSRDRGTENSRRNFLTRSPR